MEKLDQLDGILVTVADFPLTPSWRPILNRTQILNENDRATVSPQGRGLNAIAVLSFLHIQLVIRNQVAWFVRLLIDSMKPARFKRNLFYHPPGSSMVVSKGRHEQRQGAASDRRLVGAGGAVLVEYDRARTAASNGRLPPREGADIPAVVAGSPRP